MPFSYVVHKEYRLVISTGSDCVTFGEIKTRQDQTKTDPAFNPEFNQIVDLRAVTRFDMSSEQAKALARRMIFATTAKRAFVGANPVVCDVASLWQIIALKSEHPSQIRVKYEHLAVLTWRV